MGEPLNPQDGEQDLAILFPEVTATIAGVSVTVREYGFEESLRLNALFAPIVNAMSGAAMDGTLQDPASLDVVFSEHADNVIKLIARACDRPEAWVAHLQDEDGQNLRLLWWSVNAGFFGRRVAARVVQQMTAPAGPTSSPSLSGMDTTKANSGDTPVAS
ncbi:MAG TPA: DUF6631 family protein [Rhodanobacter sp.]|nr:DUF6631 family protein [Rhodanobacter sp.]